MDQTNDLSLWPILQRIPTNYICMIDRFFIFNQGESILIFCKNGKCYGFGQNPYGLLGVHPDDFRQKCLNLLRYHCFNCRPILDEPRELIKLRFQNVIAIAKGEKHMMALTELGDLYGWGANQYGQLGIGWFRSCSLEPTLILHDVQKVCCGPKHTVALIYDGSIKLWGKFPGCPHNYTPQRLVQAPTSMIDLISTKFLTISYNNRFDDDDKSAFYAWGNLKNLGLSGPTTIRLTYKRTEYNRIFKIVPLGVNKILVLTHEGRLSMISIQKDRVRSLRHPFRVIDFVNFCIDIPDDPNVVVIRDRHGTCFVWDENQPCGCNLIKTNFSSIADCACLYSSAYTPQLTKLPAHLIEIHQQQQQEQENKSLINLSQNYQLHFNDPKYSDLEFRFIHYQNKPIYAHRSILSKHNEFFKNLLTTMMIQETIEQQQQKSSLSISSLSSSSSSSSSLEMNSKPLIIKIETNSYISMFFYLRYIYFKQIDLNRFDDVTIMDLYDIAAKFQDQKLRHTIIDHYYKLLPPNYQKE